ncbi:MAG: hypothetical protein HXO58_08105 [Rothia mucilaginosa]|uniref:Uncharacterized protein n=1 Tax=Rothia mucilaginosa TaxID=43675 RepID=A0A930L4K7_9MICC|nr:hypothetical protein [Rothia mucilaginosa]MBF1659781.1 hypothetical protein [Rothia mucilaginosa]
MIETHLSFRTIDTIDTLLDGLEKLDPSRFMFAHLDLVDTLNELLLVRSSSEAVRLRRRIGKIRAEIESVLF